MTALATAIQKTSAFKFGDKFFYLLRPVFTSEILVA